jgi:glycosyltransferase involved in cell wall biosynthesis
MSTCLPKFPQALHSAEQNHRLLQGAATVVAPSHFLAEKIQAEFGPLPITIIPYGIDVDRLNPQVRRYPAPTPLVFFFAGALLETKGVHLLLHAFQALTSSHVRLRIYGSGPLATAVQAATQRDQRITYGGVYQMEQLPALLHQADVVIVPSAWHENMPLIMQEAQACGVPTLVSDVGGMTECVTDGVNGFTFRVGDVEDLRHKLQMIVDQPELLNGIKENMRNPKPGQYRVTTLAQEAAMYLEQYERILAKAQQVVG